LRAERLNTRALIDIAKFGIFGLLIATSELDVLFQFSRDRLAPLSEHPQLLDFLRAFLPLTLV
jgi:hypothetical protein